MAFSPNLFLSNAVMHTGFAKSSRFRVIMNMPPGVRNFVSGSAFTNFMDSLDQTAGGAVQSLNSVLNGFIANNGGGVAVPSNDSTVSRFLSLQCEATELPGRSIQTNDVDIYGPVFKRPYKNAYADHSFTFICTNDFYERRLFDTWMEAMIPSDTQNVRYAKNSRGERQYQTDIAIVQYDDFIKQIYAVKLIDAFPLSVGSMGMNWSDDNFHRLTVQFAFTKYDVITNLQYDFPNASDIFGALGTRILGGITL